MTNLQKVKKAPYNKLKKKLEDELLQASFAGNWKKKQEANLQLLWLKTILETEKKKLLNRPGTYHEDNLINSLTFEIIKFPKTWQINDITSYPFAHHILAEYRKILLNKEYKGIFKPESLLPLPKIYIKKAILFTFDYINLKDPVYSIPDKENLADNLNTISVLLDNFIDTNGMALPNSGINNYKIGISIKEESKEKEISELNLIDWRTESNWIAHGVRYAENGLYEYAFACFDQVKKINPSNQEINNVISFTYFYKGEELYHKGEFEAGLIDIKKAANMNNKDALKWLEKSENK